MSSGNPDTMIETYEINSFPIYEVPEAFQFPSAEEKLRSEKKELVMIQLDKYKAINFPLACISKNIKKLNSKEQFELVKDSTKQQPKGMASNIYLLMNADYYDISEHISNNEFYIINQSD